MDLEKGNNVKGNRSGKEWNNGNDLRSIFSEKIHLRDREYREILHQNPGIISVPRFDGKKRFITGKGEKELFRISKVRLGSHVSMSRVARSSIDPGNEERSVFKTSWYTSKYYHYPWEIVVTNERIICYMRFIAINRIAVLIPHLIHWIVGAVIFRNSVLVIQRPLSEVMNVTFTEMVGEVSDWRKPIQLHLQFATPNGYLNIRATGKGIRKFEKNGSLVDQLLILKESVTMNKRFIVASLQEDGTMTKTDGNGFQNDLYQDDETELQRSKIEDGLYEQHYFTSKPLVCNPPIYAGDLKRQ